VARINDMEMAGFLVYTGKDPAAKQLSAVYAGSDLCRELIDTNQTDLRDVLDAVTTELKYVLNCHAVVRD
jgi:hypothetical protein